MRRAAAVSLALVALTSVPDMAAGVELDRGDLRLELNGSLRTLATLTRDVRLDELERRLQGVPVR